MHTLLLVLTFSLYAGVPSLEGIDTRGSAGSHLSKEARSDAVGHVAARGYTSCSLS
jgi:hypothetical protein